MRAEASLGVNVAATSSAEPRRTECSNGHHVLQDLQCWTDRIVELSAVCFLEGRRFTAICARHYLKRCV